MASILDALTQLKGPNSNVKAFSLGADGGAKLDFFDDAAIPKKIEQVPTVSAPATSAPETGTLQKAANFLSSPQGAILLGQAAQAIAPQPTHGVFRAAEFGKQMGMAQLYEDYRKTLKEGGDTTGSQFQMLPPALKAQAFQANVAERKLELEQKRVGIAGKQLKLAQTAEKKRMSEEASIKLRAAEEPPRAVVGVPEGTELVSGRYVRDPDAEGGWRWVEEQRGQRPVTAGGAGSAARRTAMQRRIDLFIVTEFKKKILDSFGKNKIRRNAVARIMRGVFSGANSIQSVIPEAPVKIQREIASALKDYTRVMQTGNDVALVELLEKRLKDVPDDEKKDIIADPNAGESLRELGLRKLGEIFPGEKEAITGEEEPTEQDFQDAAQGKVRFTYPNPPRR